MIIYTNLEETMIIYTNDAYVKEAAIKQNMAAYYSTGKRSLIFSDILIVIEDGHNQGMFSRKFPDIANAPNMYTAYISDNEDSTLIDVDKYWIDQAFNHYKPQSVSIIIMIPHPKRTKLALNFLDYIVQLNKKSQEAIINTLFEGGIVWK